MANKNQNKTQTLSPEEMKRFTLSITTPTGYARTTPAVAPGVISPPPEEEIKPSVPPPTPTPEVSPVVPKVLTQQEKIAQIRSEIEKVTAQLKEVQAKLEIIKEAERKGMAVSPKTTVEQAKQFLAEWKPPDINEVETITGELPAQKSSSNIFINSDSIINLLSQQLADVSQKLKEAREERKSFMEILKERIVSPFRREEFMRKAEEEAGLERLKALREATFAQITSLREQINRVQAERDAALAASEARLAPMAFIRGEQARIQERYQRELSRLNAQLGTQIALYQAQSDQIEEARRWINDIVEAATWDEQFRWQQLTTMATLHDRELSELGEEYRNWFSTLITLARLNYQEARESKRFVLQQMIENPEAGISPEDTPEEAAEKVATYKATFPQLREQIIGGFRVLVGPTGKVIATREITETREPTVPFSVTALRAGLVGLTQKEAFDIVQSETPPEWFRKQVEEQYQMSVHPDFLQTLWEEKRENALEVLGGTSKPGSFEELLKKLTEEE